MIFYEHHSLNSFEAANDACLMDSGVLSAQVLPYVSSAPPKITQFRAISAPDEHHFQYFANKALLLEHQKCFQGDITKQTLGMLLVFNLGKVGNL
jgi:hypothetical protein